MKKNHPHYGTVARWGDKEQTVDLNGSFSSVRQNDSLPYAITYFVPYPLFAPGFPEKGALR
jgi:hypothetical protein